MLTVRTVPCSRLVLTRTVTSLCWYYDAGRSNDWILTSRRNIVTSDGNYFLVVKLWDQNNVLVEIPLRTAVDPVAPVLAYRYIESPDGQFYYPLFASADEAAYVDVQNGGTSPGSAHAHVFPDEPTGTVWYMPDTGGEHNGCFCSLLTLQKSPTPRSQPDDDLYAPASLNLQNYSVSRTPLSVNIPRCIPHDVVATVTGLPTGLTYSNGYLLTGTLVMFP